MHTDSSENNSSVDELNESNLSMSVNYWLTIVFPSLIATLFVVTIIFIVIGVIVFLRRGRQGNRSTTNYYSGLIIVIIQIFRLLSSPKM